MGINNAVYRGGKVMGFRCLVCYDVVPSMMGTTCNKCRAEERRHRELLDMNALLKENNELKKRISELEKSK